MLEQKEQVAEAVVPNQYLFWREECLEYFGEPDHFRELVLQVPGHLEQVVVELLFGFEHLQFEWRSFYTELIIFVQDQLSLAPVLGPNPVK